MSKATTPSAPSRELKNLSSPAPLLGGGIVKASDGTTDYLNPTQKMWLFLGAVSREMSKEEADKMIKGEVEWPDFLEKQERERLARVEAERLQDEADAADPIPNPKFRRYLKEGGWARVDQKIIDYWFGAQHLNQAQQWHLRKKYDVAYPVMWPENPAERFDHVKEMLGLARGYLPFPPKVEDRERVDNAEIRGGTRYGGFKP